MMVRILYIVSILLFSTTPLLAENRTQPPVFVGEDVVIEAEYEDTLVDLAIEHKIGYVELLSANPGVDHLVPGEGQEILIPFRQIIPDVERKGVVINLGELRLYHFVGDEIKTYPIGIGREGLDTPMGETKIRTKVEGPKWRPTERMRKENPELPKVVETGPDNPLGTHALYLDWPAYLIHGTHKPSGIGRRVSSGCIRMYPEDIIQVFEDIPKDTPVRVINQPVKLAWDNDQLLMEAHPEGDQMDEVEFRGRIITPVVPDNIMKTVQAMLKSEDQEPIDWSLVKSVLVERRGIPQVIYTRKSPQS